MRESECRWGDKMQIGSVGLHHVERTLHRCPDRNFGQSLRTNGDVFPEDLNLADTVAHRLQTHSIDFRRARLASV